MSNKLIFSIIFIGLLIFYGVMHEQVHVRINNSYGLESHVYYFKYFPNLVTETMGQCNEDCIKDHNLNEVVGYPLEVILLAIGTSMFFLIKEDK